MGVDVAWGEWISLSLNGFGERRREIHSNASRLANIRFCEAV